MDQKKPSIFVSHVTETIGRLGERPAFHKMCEAVEPTMVAALRELTKWPQEMRVTVRHSTDPAGYGPRGRADLGVKALLSEISDLSGYIALVNAYKVKSVVEDIIDTLNRRRFALLIGAVRSLMEMTAQLHHLRRQDAKALGELASISAGTLAKAIKSAGAGQVDQNIIKKLLDANTALRRQVQMRKTNVMPFRSDQGDRADVPAAVTQTSVLTLIDRKLKFDDTAFGIGPRQYYDALCEAIHPNELSYALFMDTAGAAQDALRTFHIKSEPSDWTLTAAILELIAAPIVGALPQAVQTLREMKISWERSQRLSIDFRAYIKAF